MSKSVSQSISGTLDRPRVVAPSKTCGHDVDVDVERKQAQAIASLPDSITHYYAYSNEDITVISLRLPVP